MTTQPYITVFHPKLIRLKHRQAENEVINLKSRLGGWDSDSTILGLESHLANNSRGSLLVSQIHSEVERKWRVNYSSVENNLRKKYKCLLDKRHLTTTTTTTTKEKNTITKTINLKI